MNTVTINYGKICWHDHATKTIGPTTHQINWYCPDCGYTRTTYPTPGDSADAPVQQAEHYRAAAESALRALEVYMKLPSDRWPGPPTTAILRLRAALKGEQPVEPSGSERGEV